MCSGEHRLTNAGGIALLKRKLKDIKELDATLAVFNASNSVDLDALIYAGNGVIAHHSEEIERRKTQKKAAAAKVAAATAAGGKGKGKHKSKKGNDKLCEHCHKPGHTAQNCFFESKKFRLQTCFRGQDQRQQCLFVQWCAICAAWLGSCVHRASSWACSSDGGSHQGVLRVSH